MRLNSPSLSLLFSFSFPDVEIILSLVSFADRSAAKYDVSWLIILTSVRTELLPGCRNGMSFRGSYVFDMPT